VIWISLSRALAASRTMLECFSTSSRGMRWAKSYCQITARGAEYIIQLNPDFLTVREMGFFLKVLQSSISLHDELQRFVLSHAINTHKQFNRVIRRI
jgi:hypothetical protein